MSRTQHFVYVLTNNHKNVLYVGVTSDLVGRLDKHRTGKTKGFAYKYNCFNLVYCETHKYIDVAIKREKEIKKWRREKKVELISRLNPEWEFLDESIMVSQNDGIEMSLDNIVIPSVTRNLPEYN